MAPPVKILLLLAVAIVLNACRARKEEGRVEAPPVGQWYRVISTEGIGESKTELFRVEAGQWRVKWETSPIREDSKGYINLWIYSGEELFVDHPVSSYDTDYTEGEALISGAGSFYINVGSEGLLWELTVEEYREEGFSHYPLIKSGIPQPSLKYRSKTVKERR